MVYKGRDKLRDAGIRVGDDLSKKRRDTLKHLKDTGRQGYFYRDELVVRDAPLSTKGENNDQTRVKLRAQRRLEQINENQENNDSSVDMDLSVSGDEPSDIVTIDRS